MGLIVSEVFGPTVQGEGPTAGRPCAFVRLGRCNLTCGGPGPATWKCDTSFTWDWKGQNGVVYQPMVELAQRSIPSIVADLQAIAAPMVVISGGEPLLQQGLLADLCAACTGEGWRVEIETNGTRAPSKRLTAVVDQFNVSPKLSNSGVSKAKRYEPDSVEALDATGKAIWKFVCLTAEDVAEADDEYVRPHDLRPVWVMPGGTTPEAMSVGAGAIADAAVDRGWSISSRLHVLAWGDARGH